MNKHICKLSHHAAVWLAFREHVHCSLRYTESLPHPQTGLTTVLDKNKNKQNHLFSRKLSAWRTKAICISTEVRLLRVSLAGTSNTSVICFTISHISETFWIGEGRWQPVTLSHVHRKPNQTSCWSKTNLYVCRGQNKYMRIAEVKKTSVVLTLSSRVSATEAHKSPRLGWMWPFTIFSLKM